MHLYACLLMPEEGELQELWRLELQEAVNCPIRELGTELRLPESTENMLTH